MNQQEYHRMALSVLDKADEFRTLWKWLAQRIMPRTEDAVTQVAPGASRKRDSSSVASESMHTLAAAHYNYITPAGMPWFRFRSADKQDNTIYAKWYSNASEVALQELSKSNFYAEVQECYLSRVLYGTALLLCETKRGGGLLFRNVPVGSFGIAENSDGEIDTVCRRFKYTAAAAVDRWAEKDARGRILNFGNLPDEVRRAYSQPENRYRQEFDFLHLVTPRRSYTVPNGGNGGKGVDGKGRVVQIPAKQRTFASIYLFEGGSYPVLEEGGYEEFPYLVTRFLKWPGTVWGYAPGFKCMSALDSLMKLENNMDILSDLAAFPRVLKLAEQVGEIDFRAGGQTIVSEVAAQLGFPREWGTGGQYNVGKDRIEAKEQQIKSAFYVPFLNVISSVERTMTATEVQARQEEQALSFSPTFSQFTSELNVLLYRIFAILFRQGKFNAPDVMQPQKLKVSADDGTENFGVAVPQVHYMGRISQAIEKSQRIGLESLMETLGGFVHQTGDSSAVDYVDTGKAVKHIFDTSGAPTDVLRSDEEVAQIRTAREQMQMAQLQAEVGAKGAGAIRDLSAV